MDHSKFMPDEKGHFGEFGGKYVPETLFTALRELEAAYRKISRTPAFKKELKAHLQNFAGRPTALFPSANWSRKLGNGTRIYLKREDLCHTGAHKINNTIGQALLARALGKKRIIAETGAGQHGVAAATAARLFGLSCDVYMGEKDIQRQELNVFKMRLLGARVCPVISGSKTLKDATNEAIRDWVGSVDHTHYMIGSTVGPHPYPMIVRDFQSVIGLESRRQILETEKRLPDYAIACVGGGSNSMGLFYPFLKDSNVQLIGVEAAGEGLGGHHHSAALTKGRTGILHGMKSYLLQTDEGQVEEAHSVSAGLDYPSVGPEHSYLKESGRARYVTVDDKLALKGFSFLTETEGIIPALESSHAIGWLLKHAAELGKGKIVVVCLSGRGDKDLETVRHVL